MKFVVSTFALLLITFSVFAQGGASKEELRNQYTPADSLPTDFKTLVEYLPSLIDTGLTYRRYILPVSCALMNGGGILLVGPTSILDHFRKSPTSSEFNLNADVVVPLPDYNLPDSSRNSSLTQITISTLRSVQDKIRATAICMSAAMKTKDGYVDFVAIKLDHIDGSSMNYLLPYHRNQDYSITFSKPILQNAPPFLFEKK